MADDDPLSAVLEDLRSRHKPVLRMEALICDSDRHKWPCHAHRLLAAVDAALAAADDFDRCVLESSGATQAETLTDCAGAVRDAITRGLLREGQ